MLFEVNLELFALYLLVVAGGIWLEYLSSWVRILLFQRSCFYGCLSVGVNSVQSSLGVSGSSSPYESFFYSLPEVWAL